ncbi:MAG: ABC transporter permease [Clostridia bacterium]|nr:ABC transporter permease [Clostridia bacterium]
MEKNTRTSVREPIMRIVKRDGMGVIPRIMVYVIAIVLALVVDALFIYFVTGLNPFDVYKVMFGGTFGNQIRFMWAVRDLVTLLIVGIALAPAFKMRFWNIGGEGQILMGALLSALCMVYIGDKVPSWALFAAMALSAMFIGALWAFVPAYFKAHWNTNETLFTLMMNYVATSIMACVTNILRGQASSLGKLNKGTKAGWFPKPLSELGIETGDSGLLVKLMDQYFSINIVVVIVLMILMFVYLKYSKHGYEITVVGESENTARYAGINVKKVMIRTMLISGAICGLAGFLIVGGKDQSISTQTAGGRGFDAIIVAWLAKFNTFTMALISFMLVFLENGAHEIASSYNLNDYASDIISGIILFFILGCEFFINYRLVFRKKGVR